MHSQRRSAHSGPVIRVQYTPHPVTDRRSPAIRSFESLRMAVSQFPSAARLLPRQYSGLALIRSLPVADQVLILRLQSSSFQRRIEPTRAPPFQGGSCFSRINTELAEGEHHPYGAVPACAVGSREPRIWMDSGSAQARVGNALPTWRRSEWSASRLGRARSRFSRRIGACCRALQIIGNFEVAGLAGCRWLWIF